MMCHAREAMRVVRHLRPYADYPPMTSPEIQLACREDVFLNIRTLIDFLAPTKPDGRDFYAVDVVPGWNPKPEDAVNGLHEHKDTVSQPIVHFTKRRIQHESWVGPPMGAVKLMRRLVDDLEAVWAEFERAYELATADNPRHWHDFGDWRVPHPASAEARTGLQIRTCSACGASELLHPATGTVIGSG